MHYNKNKNINATATDIKVIVDRITYIKLKNELISYVRSQNNDNLFSRWRDILIWEDTRRSFVVLLFLK
jgi:hypothetical protein